jgi:hypothetical protein
VKLSCIATAYKNVITFTNIMQLKNIGKYLFTICERLWENRNDMGRWGGKKSKGSYDDGTSSSHRIADPIPPRTCHHIDRCMQHNET